MIRNTLTKAVLILLLLIAVMVILYFGSAFILPLAFGGLFAMIFYPLSQKLMARGIPKWGTISLSVLIFLLVGGGLVTLIGLQTRSLVQDWPKIRQELQKRWDQTETFIIQNIGIASQERIERIEERIASQSDQLQSLLRRFFGSFVSLLTGTLLALIYMVMFLLEDKRLTQFIVKLAPADQQEEALDVIRSSRAVATQYLIGRMWLIGILSVLYSAGFLAFGLQYAIPIALLVALLSIIPYLGNIIGAVIAITVALATGAGATTMFGVLGTMALAQFLESYVLTPWIMGQEVTLNPLVTLAAVVGFSGLWGVAGTILAIPITGIVKVVCDRVDGLKPYGYVLGLREANDSPDE